MAVAPPEGGRRGPGERRRTRAKVTTLALVLAIAAALAGLSAGPGYRSGLLSIESAFGLMRGAAYGGIAAALLGLIGMVLARPGGPRRGFYRALAAFVVGLVVVGIPWSYLWKAQSVPPIHDITTDTEDPPAFDAVLPLRAEAPNPPEHAGPEVAAQQRAAYPDVAPLMSRMAPELVFRHALASAREMGWRIVASEPQEGRIEAVDQTPWFGFLDDVVVRVRPQGDGSRIDVRSKSRIGVSDLGTNAERVRAYLRALQSRTRAEQAPPPG